MSVLDVPSHCEDAPDFASVGVQAFTTTRDAGSFLLSSNDEPARNIVGRWLTLVDSLRRTGASRLAYSHQVHEARVLRHDGNWTGWLRATDADGHFSPEPGTAMAVTLADCVPVFVAHPGGYAAILHAGWRGTAAQIVSEGIAMFRSWGCKPADLLLHCGPAICGACYEVGPDVYARLTGRSSAAPTAVDLRSILADQAHAAGVRRITVSASCTRCHNDRFFSHRCGDHGRQLGVIVTPTPATMH